MKKGLILLFVTIFLSGCPSGKESNNSGGSKIIKKAVHYEVFAERRLMVDLSKIVPYSSFGVSKQTSTRNIYIDLDKKTLSYTPEMGFIGKAEFDIEFYNYSSTGKILISFDIEIKKPILENNRDYTISYNCENISELHSRSGPAKDFDINIVDGNLELFEKVHDNVAIRSLEHTKIPEYSKATSDYEARRGNASYSFIAKSIAHHKTFLSHMNDIMQITCNYPSNTYTLIYPIQNEGWYASKPYNSHPGYRFDRNDLYFHISILSDLHSKIYLKEHQSGSSRKKSFINANKFMEKIFPNSHYTAELLRNWDAKNNTWIDITDGKYSTIPNMYNAENEPYYEKIGYLSENLNITNETLLNKIANNYESYYIYQQQCLDPVICGILFPEYTKSVTLNPKFENNINEWMLDKNVVLPAIGQVEWLPTKDIVSIDYTANRRKNSSDGFSSLSLYQLKDIDNSNINNYFIKFNLSEIYGGYSGGNPVITGTLDSGFASVYVCVKDKSKKDLGCMFWSDHTNKFDLAWGPLEDHKISSNDFFNNNRLRNVIRRTAVVMKDVSLKISIGKQLDNHLPNIDKSLIKYIDYGIFVTEFRNQNGCYFCKAKIKANEINLLKH